MRSLVVLFALVAVAVAAPNIGHAFAFTVPSAVSHQSRVDVHSAPAVVATPVEVASYAPVVVARAIAGPAVYSGGSAVSHQSRVDVHSSPAVIATEHFVDAPTVVEARSVYPAPDVVAHHVLTPAVFTTW